MPVTAAASLTGTERGCRGDTQRADRFSVNGGPVELLTAIAISFLALLALLYLARRPLLVALGQQLVAREPPHDRADAIVILNGNISTRPFRAAELYHEHPAPLWIARLSDTEEVRLGVIPNISDATCRLLVREGVPESAIRLVPSRRWVGGTWAEALVLAPGLRTAGTRSINLVTDTFHSRRAVWAFRRVLGPACDIRCARSRFSQGLENQWWHSEYGLVQVVIEYLKFTHYWMQYRKRSDHGDESSLPDADLVRRVICGKAPMDALEDSATDEPKGG